MGNTSTRFDRLWWSGGRAGQSRHKRVDRGRDLGAGEGLLVDGVGLPSLRPRCEKSHFSAISTRLYYFLLRYATLQDTKISSFFVSICADVDNKV